MEHNFRTSIWIDWCPGCGNYGIVSALSKALKDLSLDPSKIVIVSGIGCSGKTPHFINVNGVHTLHGRAIPFATGIKLSNPGLTVIVTGGDGDLLGIGAGHFVSLGRRNLDITVIIHDNMVYGLTKGQASPTLGRGVKTKAMPMPNLQDALNPIILALASGYTFIARGYALNVPHLKKIFMEAIKHRGSAVIDVLQPCVTYNDIHTKEFYSKRLYDINEEGWDPTVNSREEELDMIKDLWIKAGEWNDKIPIGVFYVNRYKAPFEERIDKRLRSYLKNPPHTKKIEVNKRPIIGINLFMKVFHKYIVDVNI